MPTEPGQTSSGALCSTGLSEPTKPPPSLLDFPPEIQLLIFDVLQAKDDPTTSACLGLTCKRFYPLFRARFTKAPLEKSCCKGSLRGVDHRGKWYYGSVCAECTNGRNDLYELLRDWMPRDLAYRAGLYTGKVYCGGEVEDPCC
jgi:hypothetical protein